MAGENIFVCYFVNLISGLPVAIFGTAFLFATPSALLFTPPSLLPPPPVLLFGPPLGGTGHQIEFGLPLPSM